MTTLLQVPGRCAAASDPGESRAAEPAPAGPAPGTAPRSNVFLLRRPGAPAAPVERVAMPEMLLDLQPSIDGLRSLKSDLEAYYWDHPCDDQVRRNERFQIGWCIRQLTDRTAALEGILMHKGTSRLVLRGLSPTEQEALESAATLLDQWIHEDEAFQRVLQVVSAALAAADRIGLRAAGAVAAPGGVRPAE